MTGTEPSAPAGRGRGARGARVTRGPRITVRTKLSLIYTGVFLAGGILLLALNYAFVAGSLVDQSPILAERVPTETAPSAGTPFAETSPAAPADGEAARSVTTVAITDYRSAVLSDLLLRSALGLVAVTGLAAVAGWVIAGRPLRRLHRVTETARRLSEDDLGRRLALTGPDDEFRELGDTFDGMLERLETAFEGRRRFVANASHELRTPIAAQKAAVEVPLAQGRVPDDLRPALERVVEAADRSERLIAGLLLLVRSDGAAVNADTAEPVDLADAARRALRERAADAEAAGVRVEADLSPALVEGDHVLLEHLVHNLVDNAVRYNVPGGEVRVASAEEGGRSVLRVANTGAPVEAPERLFEPFERGTGRVRTGDGGTGLGLAIVRSIAEAHGGAVAAAARPGGGLEVEARLPRLDPDAPAPAGAAPA